MADLKLPRVNKVMISGRITQELELKYTPKGTPVIRFTLAMDKRSKDEADQWQQSTVFVDVVAWTNQAEGLVKQAHKGTAVLVEGRIDTRSYVDQNNQNRKVFEVIADFIHVLEWKPRAEGEGDTEEPPLPDEHQQPAARDDVPF